MRWSEALRLVGVAVQVWLGFRAYRAYAGLPQAPPPAAPGATTDARVSVVVPARNEAANLRRLLPTLVAQGDAVAEVIVVDDGSTDATVAVARHHGARVVTAGPLPPGWTGKPHACMVGALAASSPWLLFVDADTWHEPGAVVAALAYAEQEQVEALSLMLRHECGSVWERLLLPYAFQHLFAGVDGRAVNDAASPTALLNGQYLLIRAAAYGRAGTHAAVRGSIVEDVELGSLLKTRGVRLRIARGEALGGVRMYRGLGGVIAGFSKNSFRFALQEPVRGTLVVASTLAAAQPAYALLACAVATARGRPPAGPPSPPLVLSYLVAAAALAPWQRWFGSGFGYALLQPATALLFQTISLGGIWSASGRGRTRWKGRRY
jgi:chlorobactene glucosyltransferase